MEMRGETNLKNLIAEMHPTLAESPYVFCTIDPETAPGGIINPLGTFREAEGISIIITQPQAVDADLPFDSTWACITLAVHSSLKAVGFLATVVDQLARAGISVNPVSGYYHDHLFVPWESRRNAIDLLEAMRHP
jgi:hypothetical protein